LNNKEEKSYFDSHFVSCVLVWSIE